MKKALVSLLLPIAVFLPACSNSDSQSDPSTSDAPTQFNDADVMFAQMMIPHHEQAIEMSDMALDPTIMASQQIRDLALQIKTAQDPEIEQMRNWLTEWGKPLTPEDDMDHSSMMEGMLTSDELAQLASLQGADFDKSWIQAMIAHHKGAIAMANDVVAEGSHPKVRQLAENITTTQQSEINTLEALL